MEPWLTAGQVELPGDYNNDAVVDAADFTIWRDALGSDTLLPGDTTPGNVSMQDYQVWRDFYGTERTPYSVPPVPEPSGWFGLATGMLALFSRRGRRQR